jgi:hypothetical protein
MEKPEALTPSDWNQPARAAWPAERAELECKRGFRMLVSTRGTDIP